MEFVGLSIIVYYFNFVKINDVATNQFGNT